MWDGIVPWGRGFRKGARARVCVCAAGGYDFIERIFVPVFIDKEAYLFTGVCVDERRMGGRVVKVYLSGARQSSRYAP